MGLALTGCIPSQQQHTKGFIRIHLIFVQFYLEGERNYCDPPPTDEDVEAQKRPLTCPKSLPSCLPMQLTHNKYSINSNQSVFATMSGTVLSTLHTVIESSVQF